MTDKLNFSSAGHLIEAEQITVPSEAPYKVRLKHHYVKEETPSSVEIWQNPDKTGSFLTEESYTGSVSANGYFQVDYDGQEDGDVKYCNTLLFHSGQAGTTWYVWYKSQGDVVDAESLNSKADKVPGTTAGNLASLDATGNLQDSGYSASDFATVATYSGTLSAVGWSGTAAPYSQTVSITGITADDEPIIDVVMSGNYAADSIRNEEWGYIYRAVTGTNSITFYAIEKPTVDLPFTAKVVK